MIKRIFLASIVLIAVLALTGCGAGGDHRAPELITPPIAEARFDTTTVTRGNVSEIFQRTGIVRVESHPHNFGPVSASFGKFYVLPGDEVEYGQLLARLNTENIEQQIERLTEQIADMRARFETENELLRINWQLARLQAGAPAHNLELELAQERQTLQLRHAEENLEELKARYAQMQLRAPYAGTVVFTAHLTAGSWVPSFTPVIFIAPEDAQVFVEYVDSAPLPLPYVSVYAHIEGRVYNATRIRLAREHLLRYGTPPLRFALEAVGGNYPPLGAYVFLEIFTQHAEDVLRLPRNAVFHSYDWGYYVHQLTNGQLDVTPITVGIKTTTYIEITSGIREGDEVYVRAHGLLRPPVVVIVQAGHGN